jgi:hypothetical protein
MERANHDWLEIQRVYDAGATEASIRSGFGILAGTFSRATREGRFIRRPEDENRPRPAPGHFKYCWAEVQAYYDAGHGYVECRLRFGFCAATWCKAIERGHLKVRAREWPIERTLREAKCRTNVKRRLLSAGILENRCDWCGLTEWRGKPLSIQLDHANGIRNDNRLENLRMLCPNCHSQTETFASRNWKIQSNPASPSW